jgi:uncharacterized membrane protein
MANAPEPLPDHLDDSIEAIARLHASHKRQSTRFQKLVNLTVSLVGRPASLAVLTLSVVGWISGNILAVHFGYRPADAPPFQWLELGCSFVALYMTILILITQRHDSELDEYRQQLALQLAILGEQKSAKIIELLHELRKDSPLLGDRTDSGAEAMAKPVDPETILAALKDASRPD